MLLYLEKLLVPPIYASMIIRLAKFKTFLNTRPKNSKFIQPRMETFYLNFDHIWLQRPKAVPDGASAAGSRKKQKRTNDVTTDQ